jgi:hypothetical protein
MRHAALLLLSLLRFLLVGLALPDRSSSLLLTPLSSDLASPLEQEGSIGDAPAAFRETGRKELRQVFAQLIFLLGPGNMW